MSGRYRVDITMWIGQDEQTFNNTSRDDFAKNVLLYLIAPSTNSQDIYDVISTFTAYGGFDFNSYVNSYVGVSGRMMVKYSQERSLCNVYSETNYRIDLVKQIERLKAELPFKFNVDVRLTPLEVRPTVAIIDGTLDDPSVEELIESYNDEMTLFD